MTPDFQAGVYDMPEDVYHADPVPGGSLSASGAKKLLSSPARFEYDRLHPPQSSDAMEFGTAAHKLTLGKGAEVVVVDAGDWRTQDARDIRNQARSEGKIPLLRADYVKAQALAAAVHAHPLAGPLFNPLFGDPERSLFWRDERFGIWRRARLDWLPHSTGYRMIIPDLKSCVSAAPEAMAKACGNFGYYVQSAWYVDAVQALGLAVDPAFLLVFVESAPPHLISVGQLDNEAMDAGRERGEEACERYRDCTEAGVWPGYPDDVIHTISLPPWTLRQLESV